MRTKIRKPDFGAVSRASIKRDFEKVQLHPKANKMPKNEDSIKITDALRISYVGEKSDYYKYRNLIAGKLVRVLKKTTIGKICSFVYDDDRKALNKAAGWSDNKKEYLFNCIKFKGYED